MKRFVIWTSVALLALIGAGVRQVTTPPSHAQPLGDALVVHAGGRGERLNSALALMDNGAAPVMVIMNGNDPLWPDAFALCNRSNPYIVLCPTPQPDNTVGEASTLGDLIAEQNWRTVVVVTSDYHLRRTMILDGRCAGDADLRGVAAPADITTARRAALIGREVIALPQAYLSGCR